MFSLMKLDVTEDKAKRILNDIFLRILGMILLISKLNKFYKAVIVI